MYLYKNKGTERAASSAISFEICWEWTKVGHEAQGVRDGLMGRHGLAHTFETNMLHGPDGLWSALIDHAHGQSNRQTGAIAFGFFSTVIHYRPPRQEADELSRLETKSEDKISPQDEVPALFLLQTFFTCASKSEIPNLQFVQKGKNPLVLFVLEACLMAGIRYNDKAETPTLAEFDSAQSTDSYCRLRSRPSEAERSF